MASRYARQDIQTKMVTFTILAIVWEAIAQIAHKPELYPSFEYLLNVSFPSLGMFSRPPAAGVVSALSAILHNGLITLARVGLGLAIGVPSGIIGGLLLHYLRGSGPISAITLTALRSVPLLALIPLFKYWFGLSTFAIVAYIAIGTFFVIASDSYEAAANTAPVYVQQAHLLGATPYFILRTVYLPAIRTQLSGGLRNVIGLSWAFSLGAEYISAYNGLGYLTYQSYLNSNMGQLALMALLYAFVGYGSYESTQLSLRFLNWSERILKGRIT